MFDLDKWQEIVYTINKNRVRTGITAFNVAFGIFILIVLMGFGTGFQNGIRNQFNDDAINSMYIGSGTTSKAFAGLQPGREIKFTNDDFDAIAQQVEGVDKMTGRFYLTGEFTVRYDDKFSYFNIRCVHPDHAYVEKTIMQQGRYLNDKDINEKRKVAVIGTGVIDVLFPRRNAIGEYITINGIKYKVVGVFHDEGNERENKYIYIPISTSQLAYGGGKRIHQIIVTVGDATVGESIEIQDNIHTLLASRHRFAKDDEQAIWLGNVLDDYARWMGIFDGIRFFLAGVGFLTLIAGIVGVSNIMLIIVKERTREIGVRKAIGATPFSIIGLFLQESLAVTLISGYIGMLAGMLFLQSGALTELMFSFGFPEEFFMDPNVEFSSAVIATLILAFCGTLAGYFPARKAARIQPIEALKDE
jgi:putative ABC transport system permease protein